MVIIIGPNIAVVGSVVVFAQVAVVGGGVAAIEGLAVFGAAVALTKVVVINGNVAVVVGGLVVAVVDFWWLLKTLLWLLVLLLF